MNKQFIWQLPNTSNRTRVKIRYILESYSNPEYALDKPFSLLIPLQSGVARYLIGSHHR
jgi:hypothetical protein